jgi:nicotinamidase-related amidase
MDRYTQPDFSAAALITIDTQRDTLDGQPLEIPGTSSILANMSGLLSAFRALQRPIVHVVRLYKPDGSNVDLCRRAAVEAGQGALAPGTPGSQIALGLLTDDSVYLEPEVLLAGGIQTMSPRESSSISPGGVRSTGPAWRATFEVWASRRRSSPAATFQTAPRTSIMEASKRDFRVVLIRDAVSGFTERDEAEMANIGVTVSTTEELLARLSCD